jgi:hypothetical protein
VAIVCIAIGVHNPGGMPALVGLEADFNRMVSWARNLKAPNEVVVYVITDFDGRKVSAEAIREQIDLAEIANSEWVIVYFCGHGYNVSGDTVWVLDGTESEPESFINIAGLRAAIASHGAREITIIGDACQSLAPDRKISSPILKRGRKADLNCHTDQIFAAIPGQAANIVHEDLAQKWKPVFSSVLADILCNDPAPASDIVFPQGTVVHNGTLDRYLSSEVLKKASEFGLTQNAMLLAGRVQPNNIYRQIAPFDAAQLLKLSQLIQPVEKGVLKNFSDAMKEASTGVIFGSNATKITEVLGALAGASDDHSVNVEEIATEIKPKEPNWTTERRERFELATNSEWRLEEWDRFVQNDEDKVGQIYLRDNSLATLEVWDSDDQQSDSVKIVGQSVIIDNSKANWSCLPYFTDLACLVSSRVRNQPQDDSKQEARFQQDGIQQLMWKAAVYASDDKPY